MKTPHKHAELIKAWADGAGIEYMSKITDNWVSIPSPSWAAHTKYRIKPEPKPDTIRYFQCIQWWGHETVEAGDNLKVTFDGTTNKLIKSEVI